MNSILVVEGRAALAEACASTWRPKAIRYTHREPEAALAAVGGIAGFRCGASGRDAAWERRIQRDVRAAPGRKLSFHSDADRAEAAPEDVLRGFAAGADDYLTKPFELAILIARIEGPAAAAKWLRASMNHEAPNHATANHVVAPPEPKGTFTFGEKSVHFDLLELRVRGQKFPLTLMEANVLRYLIQHEGAPVSRKAMLEDVWALHEDTDTRAIDNFIVRLRRYIEDDPTRPRHLLTVRGVGYRFVALPKESS
jgi:DNA-binding response OmpR family regulator